MRYLFASLLFVCLCTASISQAQISSINPGPSSHTWTFDDTNSFIGALNGGLYTANTSPWNGSLTNYTKTDGTTGDSVNGSVSAGVTGGNPVWSIPSITLTQAPTSTGYANLNLQFSIDYPVGGGGYSGTLTFPSFLINGTVQPPGTFGSYINGAVTYQDVNAAGVGSLLATVNYAWSTNTPGNFGPITVSPSPASQSISVTPGQDLVVTGNFLFQVDPATFNLITVPEPTSILLIPTIASIGLLRRSKRKM